MLFRVSADSTVPIYEQIVAQVTFAVAAGDLEPGGLIPSVRALAERLLVHPNTVARAYQELERRGVVAPRPGLGMEVTRRAQALCRRQRRQIVQSHVREALSEAVHSQMPPDEIGLLVREELQRAGQAHPAEEAQWVPSSTSAG